MKTNELINEIIYDENVIVNKGIISYMKNDLILVFIENSEYYDYLKNEQITHKYLFDHKGKMHLLLTTENYYRKYPNLFSSLVLKANLRLFVSRRKNNRTIKFVTYTLLLLIILANYFALRNNQILKVIYVPIISIVIAITTYIQSSKLMTKLYRSDQEATKKQLITIIPDLEKELEKEKKERL